MQKGKFIVLYGNNNCGKSTQAKVLVNTMKDKEIPVRYIKYPTYDLHPTGTLINGYLREGNPYNLTPREAQTLYAMNRTQFEPTLKSWLDAGENVVAEDYSGTSLGWGQATGVPKEYLLEINSHLLKEDLVLYMKGTRHLAAKEHKHIHEQDDELIKKAGEAFDALAEELSWTTIDANGTIEEVGARIWEAVEKSLD